MSNDVSTGEALGTFGLPHLYRGASPPVQGVCPTCAGGTSLPVQWVYTSSWQRRLEDEMKSLT